MLSGKYGKVLTVILIIAIVIIVVLLGIIAMDWYKAYNTSADTENFIGQFDDYVNNIQNADNEQNTETNLELNETNETIDPIIDENTIEQNTETSSGGSTSSTLKYKGFNVIGKIKIPKTNLECPILEEASPKAIEVAIGKLYGPGINEVGNVVLIGHNYRNGTFFSDNKKLSIGDKIYITDMSGKKVTYTISKKYTTDSNDFDYAVRDTKGKREISLSTCTEDTSYRLVIWAEEE